MSIHKSIKTLIGDYVVEIANSIEDFVYRVLVGANEVAVARLNNQNVVGFTSTVPLRMKYLEETISSM
jgi:hypothetical protein